MEVYSLVRRLHLLLWFIEFIFSARTVLAAFVVHTVVEANLSKIDLFSFQ